MKADKALVGEVQIKLGEILEQYADDVKGAVAAAVREAGGLAVKKLKETSPKRTGAYARSWKMSESYAGALWSAVTVFNNKRYMLTHLLEYGHANRNGGYTPPRPHIGIVRKETGDALEKITKERIQDI